MLNTEFTTTQTLCLSYNIEPSFLDALHNMRLIKVEIIEENQVIHHDEIGNLEKIIRLHQELNLNLEAIDVVFNLLKKERELRSELVSLQNRLRLYENI